MAAEIPESFLCPLTRQAMKDPVMDPEGTNYERVAIEDWLSRTPSSPLTCASLTTKDLVPNRFLREAIEEYCKLHKLTIADIDVKKLPKFKPPTKVKQQEVKDSVGNVSSADVKFQLHSLLNPQGECVVAATITPPKGTTRTPADIVCVIDISGSMGINATVQNDAGGLETNNLSILDIVKHAVKTIIATLQPHDRLGLVSYSTKAKKVFDLLDMNAAGKAKAQKDLDTLDADGQTNLWEGLFTGLEILRKGGSPNRLSTVLLLTDGQPNITPAKGHVPMLREYKQQYPALLSTINTFGFGYSLDSALLRDLCVEGNGMYAFIPDAGFVGTCFVNTLSNILVTLARNLSLEIITQHGVRFLEAPGVNVTQKDENTFIIPLGTLQYGQTRDVVWKLVLPPSADVAEEKEKGEGVKQKQTFGLTVNLCYQLCTGPEVKNVSVELNEQKQGDASLVEIHLLRSLFVNRVQHALRVYKEGGEEVKLGQNIVRELRDEIKTFENVKAHPQVIALLQDTEGQVTEAWSKAEWFKKWGIHYLPSLVRAHQLQQCNNFKDPGIQLYGGALFNSVREEADDIFVKLPAPSKKADSFDWGAWGDVGAAPPAAAVDMHMYYNRSGGCIAGGCWVTMADGSLKRVRDVMKGDLVASAHARAEVLCVVQMFCEASMMKMVQLPTGLLLTPYHPVRLDGAWEFPANLGEAETVPCDSVYNFVLSTGHTVVVNGVECVTLGHGYTDAVVRHPYLGAQRVIQDLQQLRNGKSFESGLIRFKPNCLLRNSSGQVCKFDPTSEV